MPDIELYASEEDLVVYGLPEAALEDVEQEVITRALVGASEKAKSYIRNQFSLPLQQIDEALVEATSWLAAFSLMNHRGYAPEAGDDNIFEKRYNLAIKWFEGISKGQINPGFIGGGSPSTGTGQSTGARPFGVSGASRGYSSRGSGSGVIHDLAMSRGGFVGD